MCGCDEPVSGGEGGWALEEAGLPRAVPVAHTRQKIYVLAAVTVVPAVRPRDALAQQKSFPRRTEVSAPFPTHARAHAVAVVAPVATRTRTHHRTRVRARPPRTARVASPPHGALRASGRVLGTGTRERERHTGLSHASVWHVTLSGAFLRATSTISPLTICPAPFSAASPEHTRWHHGQGHAGNLHRTRHAR